MDRVIQHHEFLQKLVKSSKQGYKTLIAAAKLNEIVSIVNCLRLAPKKTIVVKRLLGRRHIEKIKKLLIKNEACIKALISCILTAIVRLTRDLVCQNEPSC